MLQPDKQDSPGAADRPAQTPRDLTGNQQYDQEPYRLLAEYSADMIVRIAPDESYSYVSPASYRLFGQKPQELLGLSVFTFIHPEDLDRVREAFTSKFALVEGGSIEYRRRKKNGDYVWVENAVRIRRHPISGEPNELICVVRDITDRKRIEAELEHHRNQLESLVRQRTAELEQSRQQLLQTERLASIGTLAAGIAHEINNPIGMILLAAETAESFRDRPDGAAVVEQSLHTIIENSRRCGDIIKSVLQFARRETMEKWPAKINDILRRCCRIILPTARKHGVSLHTEFAPNLPTITISPVQMEQVIINILHNAIQSDESGVNILVRSECGPGNIRISIQDTGRGISPAHMAHLFDPFFTTRQQKGGTGLGLSLAHGIVTDHGGTLNVISEVGKGSTFTIELPLTTTPSTAEHSPA